MKKGVLPPWPRVPLINVSAFCPDFVHNYAHFVGILSHFPNNGKERWCSPKIPEKERRIVNEKPTQTQTRPKLKDIPPSARWSFGSLFGAALRQFAFRHKCETFYQGDTVHSWKPLRLIKTEQSRHSLRRTHFRNTADLNRPLISWWSITSDTGFLQ